MLSSSGRLDAALGRVGTGMLHDGGPFRARRQLEVEQKYFPRSPLDCTEGEGQSADSAKEMSCLFFFLPVWLTGGVKPAIPSSRLLELLHNFNCRFVLFFLLRIPFINLSCRKLLIQ